MYLTEEEKRSVKKVNIGTGILENEREEGREEGKAELIRNAIHGGSSVEEISNVLKIPQKEIEKIVNSKN